MPITPFILECISQQIFSVSFSLPSSLHFSFNNRISCTLNLEYKIFETSVGRTRMTMNCKQEQHNKRKKIHFTAKHLQVFNLNLLLQKDFIQLLLFPISLPRRISLLPCQNHRESSLCHYSPAFFFIFRFHSSQQIKSCDIVEQFNPEPSRDISNLDSGSVWK